MTTLIFVGIYWLGALVMAVVSTTDTPLNRRLLASKGKDSVTDNLKWWLLLWPLFLVALPYMVGPYRVDMIEYRMDEESK